MVQIYQILLVSWALLSMDFKKEYPSGKRKIHYLKILYIWDETVL